MHHWLQSKCLTEKEKQAIELSSYEDTIKFWANMTEDAQSTFRGKHRKGWRRWVDKYETFSNGAFQFMEDIRPLLEIAEPAGCPYIGVAARTISLLFLASPDVFLLRLSRC